MPSGADPKALGELLRSRRGRLRPADVGLPDGTRRRTAGLRREEAAQLANVSTTYYTFLEQGRPVRPSAAVLDALAAALRMSSAERGYLRVLAGAEAAVGTSPPERLNPVVAALVDRLDPAPTYVKGRRWDLLAANPSACELFRSWGDYPRSPVNLVRWMFTSDIAREVYLDWEREARAMLGRFRLAAARHPDDLDFIGLIDDLRRGSAEVRAWWPAHDVAAVGSGSKKLRHPRLGPTEYTHLVLQVADAPEQTMVTFSDASSHASGAASSHASG